MILKSTRLRLTHTRRRDHGRSAELVGVKEDRVDPAGVQPLCLSTSVQTEPTPTLTTQPVTSRTASLPPLPVPCPADSSCSPCSFTSLLGSPVSPPPPPPPPPPPLPAKEDASPTAAPAQWGKKTERKNAAEEVLLSPLGPFIPRFFDSSQLVSARKKLRKTPEFDANSRRGGGSFFFVREAS